MKKFLLILVVILFVFPGCKKDTEIDFTPTPPIQPPPPPPVPVVNTAPYVNTGNDIFIKSPTDTCSLIGSAFDDNDNIGKLKWKQVSGPTTAIIESPDSLITKVQNLEKGMYKFELLATDKGGLKGKDTAYVTVLGKGLDTTELILKNLQISCYWEDCAAWIENFDSYNPDHFIFKIFVKRSQDTHWIEIKTIISWATGDRYAYDIYKNILIIYGVNEEMMDVKIVY